MGVGAGPAPVTGLDLFWLPTAQAGGGVRCAWRADMTAGGSYATSHAFVDVLSEAVVPAAVVQRYRAPICEPTYDAVLCHVGVPSNGAWALVTLGYLESADAAPPPELAQIAAVVAENSAGHPAPRAPARTLAWWELPECDALDVDIDAATIIANSVGGYWEGGPGAFDRSLDAAGLWRDCPFFSDVSVIATEGGGDFSVTMAPGSGEWWSLISRIEIEDEDPATPSVTGRDVEIAGAVAARYIEYGVDQVMIVASDGVNILRVTGVSAGADNIVVATERALASLAR